MQVAKFSPVTNLLHSYNIQWKAIGADKDSRPYHVRTSLAAWKVKKFLKRCKNGVHSAVSTPEKKDLPVEPAQKKLRRSERETIVTPKKEASIIEKLMTGEPQNGCREWTRISLINALTKLEDMGRSMEFGGKAIEVGKTS